MDKTELNSTPFVEKNFLQLVLNHIPSFVFWKDLECIYQGCNSNFAASAGIESPEKIIGKTDYDLPWTKKDADFYRKIDKEVMNSGVPQINFEEPQTFEDGSTKWLRTSKIPLHDNEGKVIGILGAYEDITQRKMMELELISSNADLKKMNAKLEMMNIDLEQFAYSTSHDLKEPLRVIGSFIGLIERRYSDKLDSEGLEYMKFIKDGAERMNSLISGILTYSKIDKVEEKFSKNNFRALAEDTIYELADPIMEANAKITINLPTDKILSQPNWIKLLFHNLIMNGIKFNDSTVPEIKIDFEEQESAWLFNVSDNGIGIEDQYKDLIFKPFKRLNSRDKFEGNGIGLSIANKIVFLHGGEIYFENNLDCGTTFYFTILKNIAEADQLG